MDNSMQKVTVRPVKKNPMLLAMIGLLGFAAVIAGLLAFFWGTNMREFRRLQAQANYINTQRARAQAVLNEAMEYSKKNPAIDPILQSIGAKPRPNMPAPSVTPPAKGGK